VSKLGRFFKHEPNVFDSHCFLIDCCCKGCSNGLKFEKSDTLVGLQIFKTNLLKQERNIFNSSKLKVSKIEGSRIGTVSQLVKKRGTGISWIKKDFSSIYWKKNVVIRFFFVNVKNVSKQFM